MAVNARQKGARFERQLAGHLREYGYRTRRGQQYCGANGDADVVGLPGIHIEAKHQEKMHLYDWMEQAAESCPNGERPVVFCRADGKKWLVVMSAEEALKLIGNEL